MKALSIRQHWAWLIVRGYKDIENRTWPTSIRGKFLVHAPRKFDEKGYWWVKAETGIGLPEPHEFDIGGIIGVSEIVDCVTRSNSFWFSGPYGFVLKDSSPLPFVPLPGRLGFFDVDVDMEGIMK